MVSVADYQTSYNKQRYQSSHSLTARKSTTSLIAQLTCAQAKPEQVPLVDVMVTAVDLSCARKEDDGCFMVLLALDREIVQLHTTLSLLESTATCPGSLRTSEDVNSILYRLPDFPTDLLINRLTDRRLMDGFFMF